MEPKILRRIDSRLNKLYKPTHIGPLHFRPGEEAPKNYLSREIRLSGNRFLFLTEAGLEEFTGLVSDIESLDLFRGAADYADIWTAAKDVIERLLSEKQRPDDAHELIQLVSSEVANVIAPRRFVAPVGGITLVDLDSLELGSMRLVPPSLEALKAAGAKTDAEHVAHAIESMSGNPWLIGDATGSERVATRRFRARAELAVGILSIFASANYPHGAVSFRISLRMTAESSHGRSTYIHWEHSDGGVSANYSSSSSTQHLRIDRETLSVLKDGGWFEQALSIIGRDAATPLEEALIRAIYWFSDAQRDSVTVMQFVKYWSCIETFFSLEKEKIVSSVSSGLATILVAGGFQFFPASEYQRIKRRISKLYDLRSNALHAGAHLHVSEKDVAELSQWTAWMLITMLTLIDRGYTTPETVFEQVRRLDGVLLRGTAASSKEP